MKKEKINSSVTIKACRIGGFTLVELLVVVLIIGILAAVALPQYAKAVEKARMAEAIMIVEKIAQANDLYKMENGNYTNNINDLGIEFTGADGAHPDVGINWKGTKFFTFAASNYSGDHQYKATAQREPFGSKYALMILFDGSKFCKKYSNITSYEQKLCEDWAAGK